MKIVALHGFTGAGSDFTPIKAAFPRGDWACPDLLGHGPAPMGASLDAVFKQIEDVASPGPFCLMGYSMGGRLALQYAAAFPQRLKGLVLIGASAGILEDQERALRKKDDEALAQRLEIAGVEAFLKDWQRQPLIATQEKNIPKEHWAVMQEARRLHTKEGLADVLRSFSPGCLPQLKLEDLRRVECPVLLVAGETDTRYIDFAKELKGYLPNATVVTMPGVGHAAHLENIKEFVEVLKIFLDTVNAVVLS